MPKDTSCKLAARNGPWIMKSQAMKRFNLASSDLDSILPVTDERNPRHYQMRIKTYNLRDVEALSKRLHSGTAGSSQVSASSAKFAVANGPEIMRTNAMNDFGVSISLQFA